MIIIIQKNEEKPFLGLVISLSLTYCNFKVHLLNFYTLISGKSIVCTSSLKNSCLIFLSFQRIVFLVCVAIYYKNHQVNDISLCSRIQNINIISSKADFLWILFSIYLGRTTSSLTSGSSLLHLLRKYKIASTINTIAMMQPVALPAIIFMLLHLSVVPGIVGVGSK